MANNTQNYDIAATFASGVNVTTFNLQYVAELVSAVGMTQNDAIAFAQGTKVLNGTKVNGSGQLYSAGTLCVGIGTVAVTAAQQTAIDDTIAAQVPVAYQGALLANLGIGNIPGEYMYVSDGTRQLPAPGSGALVYWDGIDSWRYVRDDMVAITP